MERSLTGLEDALQRVGQAIEIAGKEYQRTPIFFFKKRAYYKGVLFALTLVFQLLHELNHKHDNSRGDLN